MSEHGLQGVMGSSVSSRAFSQGRVRADVQGLRGVAVLLVVLYHAGLPGLSGGFIGVDIFFVLSGFLITGLLVRESMASGHIDFVRFFARRSRRLLPAALVVTIVTTVAALWIYPPMEQREIVSAARAASVYVSNHWLAGRSVDYLAGDGDSNPLLHMWSLAVEEQFYLVWPLVITLGLRFAGGPRLGWVIGALSGLSLIACVAMTWHSQPWAFFLMPFRGWEFGAGALVQLALVRGLPLVGVRWRALPGWVGAALIAAGAVGLDTSRLYPGLWALIPTLGTALMLWSMQASSRGVGALAATPVLRRVGDLSYSWYLWHWPFLVFSRVLVPQGGSGVTAVALALSLVAATASYLWVENPIRLYPPAWLHRNPNALGAALVACLLVGGALTGVAGWISTRYMDPLQREFAGAAADIPKVYAAGCHATFGVTDLPRCAFGVADAQTKVVLFGDSHAAQWFPALDRLAHERGWQLIALTKSLCPAAQMPVYSEVLRREYHECDEWRERMFRRIDAEKPVLIIISSSPQHASAAQWREAVSLTAARLARAGVHELWVQDTPWPGFNGPSCLARAQWQGRADVAGVCAFDRDGVMAPYAMTFEAQRSAIAEFPDARSLDLTDVVCPTERCSLLRDGRLVYSDSNHIAATWAERQSERFGQALQGWSLGSAQAPAKPEGSSS